MWKYFDKIYRIKLNDHDNHEFIIEKKKYHDNDNDNDNDNGGEWTWEEIKYFSNDDENENDVNRERGGVKEKEKEMEMEKMRKGFLEWEIKEIIETEKKYVGDFQKLFKMIIKPIKNTYVNENENEEVYRQKSLEGVKDDDDGEDEDEDEEGDDEEVMIIMKREKFDKIFGQVELIKMLNERFLKKLNEIDLNFEVFMNSVEKVLDVFINNKEFMMYLSFSQILDESIEYLKLEYDNNKVFSSFLKENKYDYVLIEQILVKPIQRISKYQLLLENIGKKVKKNKDRLNINVNLIQKIEKAIIVIKTIAIKMNMKRKEKRHQKILLHISSHFKTSFDYTLLSPTRKYVLHYKNLLCINGFYENERIHLVDLYVFTDSIFFVVTYFNISSWNGEKIKNTKLVPVLFSKCDMRVIMYLFEDRLRYKIYKLSTGRRLSWKSMSLSSWNNLIPLENFEQLDKILDVTLKVNKSFLDDGGSGEFLEKLKSRLFYFQDNNKFVVVNDSNEKLKIDKIKEL